LAANTAEDKYGVAVAGAGYPFHPYGQAYELTKAFLARYWSLGNPILSPVMEPLIDRENGIRALEMLKRQVDLYASPESCGWDETAAANAFLGGRAATLECVPHYLLPYLQDPQRSKVIDRWAVAAYPGAAGGYFTMHELVMFKHCRNPEAAFEFMAYCTNPATSRRLFEDYAETASRTSPWLDSERARQMPDLGNIVKALDRGITFAAGQPKWLDMLSALWQTIGYYMKGYMTAGSALSMAAARWRELLERSLYKPKGDLVDGFSTENR
jgi:ABC-type glycerol-3-phosphate transport system substrate-binding protein